MKKTFAIIAIAAASLATSHAQIITQWNFNGNSTVTSVGVGTISVIGNATTTGFNSGGGSSDPTQPGLGYQTTNYPAQGIGSGTSGIRVDTSTAAFTSPSFTSLKVSFDLRTSNTSSRWFRVDYTNDGGSNWNLGTATRLGATANAGDTFHNSNVLSISDTLALGNANFGFRVVSVFSPVEFTEVLSGTNFGANAAYEVARNQSLPGSNYAAGTWRFDMVQVEAIPEPSTWVLIGLGIGFILLRIRGTKRASTSVG